jgi:hypothetical protein
LFERPALGWSLLGTFAVAMQVLAGHPQYVFYTGMAAALYCGLCLCQAGEPSRFVLGLAGMVVGGIALSAVQLLTGMREAGDMLRGRALPYDAAAIFSFPPENLLTLVAPGLFGDYKTFPYWGRCNLWEMSLFLGVGGLVLAVVGAILGERRGRRFSVVMVVVLLVLALGAYTPLFKILYQWLPGFNKFRGTSKFIFLASLFLALLAGTGFRELVRGRRPSGLLIGAVGVGGLLLLIAALLVWQSSFGTQGGSWWQSMMLAIRNAGEMYLSLEAYTDPVFVRQAGVSGLTEPAHWWGDHDRRGAVAAVGAQASASGVAAAGAGGGRAVCVRAKIAGPL